MLLDQSDRLTQEPQDPGVPGPLDLAGPAAIAPLGSGPSR